MKVDDGLRVRLRELAKLRSRAARPLASRTNDPLAEMLREALRLCDTLAHDVQVRNEEQASLLQRIDAGQADWDHLFDAMPQACVMTDAAGTIVRVNTAAVAILNTSAARLDTRLLMHYAEDREQFAALLRSAVWDRLRAQGTLTIRPRERAPLLVDVVALARSLQDSNTILWFLSPALTAAAGAQPARAPRGRRAS